MTFTENRNAFIVSNNVSDVSEYFDSLNKIYKNISSKHIIADLGSLTLIKKSDLKLFLTLSKLHKKQGKSFVLILNTLSPSDIPDALTTAPTLKEAFDVIFFENMEREINNFE